MLKLVFLLLLAANAALFAWQRGVLEPLFPDGREPARIAKQFNADSIQPLAASAVAATAAASVAPSATPAPNLAVIEHAPACIEAGNFDAADGKRFETLLAALALGDRMVKRTVQDVPRHMVYIPSQANKEGADHKAGELKRLGINDFYVIQDGSAMNFAISLGIFRTEEAAQAHLAALGQKGVRTAKIGLYGVASGKTAYQLRAMDAATRARFDKIKAEFPRHEFRTCESNP